MANFTEDEILEELNRRSSASKSNVDFSSDEIEAELARRQPKMSKSQALALGLEQGALLGFRPFVAGVGGGLGSLSGGGTFKEGFEGARQEARDLEAKAAEDQGLINLAGNLGGSVVTLPLQAVGAAGKAVTGLGKVGQAALSGGKLGLITGLGKGASEGENLKDVAYKTAEGGLLGAATGGLVEGGKLGIQAAGKGLKKGAERLAFKSLGGIKKSTDEALKKGNLEKIGRDLLDEGVVGFGSSKEKISERLGEQIDKKAAIVEGLLAKVKDGTGLTAEQALELGKANIVPSELASTIKERITKEFGEEINPKLYQSILDQVDEVFYSDKPLNIQQAQKFKTGLNNFIKKASYWKDAPLKQQGLMEAQTGLRRGIEKQADTYANLIGEEAGLLKGTNQGLGRMLQAQDVVDDRIARDAANRGISLTDTIVGTGGMIGGAMSGDGSLESRIKGALTGVALGGVNNLIRNRGPAAGAVLADKFGDAFQNLLKQNYITGDMVRGFVLTPRGQKALAPSLQGPPKEQSLEEIMQEGE